MTYMYNGTVSVPHNKLQTFLKTAEALKIKGIVDTGSSDDSAVSDTSVSSLVSPSNSTAPVSLWLANIFVHNVLNIIVGQFVASPSPGASQHPAPSSTSCR